ncbi:MAG: 1-(5-phosphoribosyl)-5-[(5-phosphoribosylamino)methylideneamino] imidazole-4-carboxamide isomerase [Fimbriimonadaceae bacterium]|nr:1-(5-phosphoribosyl)-5-[(5-phosphoribosylamino)methylideneamino] imidazole-4-carboxamide isomerase [Fimbriimonadaceae bacterium]
MLIWPAIDLRQGRCVRLRQGDFNRVTSYDGDPIDIARSFADQGADGIHLVDLDGAKTGESSHLRTLETMAELLSIPVEFGGGVRTLESIRSALDAGAKRVVLGTKLARDPAFASLALAQFGNAIVAGIDSNQGKVAVSGWLEATDLDEVEFAQSIHSMGGVRAIVTDIGRDGMMTGPNLDQLRDMVARSGLKIIASGGIGSLQDLRDLVSTGVEAVIVGRALYEGAFTVADAVQSLR